LSGICFGATVSIKWNGLWFWLGTLVLWAIAVGQWGWALWRSYSRPPIADRPAKS
jgi:dolichyl-phosphate-mannose-protein mannosyltransferase